MTVATKPVDGRKLSYSPRFSTSDLSFMIWVPGALRCRSGESRLDAALITVAMPLLSGRRCAFRSA